MAWQRGAGITLAVTHARRRGPRQLATLWKLRRGAGQYPETASQHRSVALAAAETALWHRTTAPRAPASFPADCRCAGSHDTR